MRVKKNIVQIRVVATLMRLVISSWKNMAATPTLPALGAKPNWGTETNLHRPYPILRPEASHPRAKTSRLGIQGSGWIARPAWLGFRRENAAVPRKQQPHPPTPRTPPSAPTFSRFTGNLSEQISGGAAKPVSILFLLAVVWDFGWFFWCFALLRSMVFVRPSPESGSSRRRIL